MVEFLYLAADLKSAKTSAKLDVKLEDPKPAEVASQLQNFSHLLSNFIYSYSPIDYEKIRGIAPKMSKAADLILTLKSLTSTKILERVKPFIILELPLSSDESELKKRKEKQRALEQIAILAFIHALWAQVFSQQFKQSGSPAKSEVRLAASMANWQVVKKVDCGKSEKKEIFAALCAIYHSVHSKLPTLTSMPSAIAASERKSYSALLSTLSSLQLPSDEMQAEWVSFTTFNACGFPPIPSPELVGEVYPELKVPKPRGNFGKKKQ